MNTTFVESLKMFHFIYKEEEEKFFYFKLIKLDWISILVVVVAMSVAPLFQNREN